VAGSRVNAIEPLNRIVSETFCGNGRKNFVCVFRKISEIAD